MLCILPPHGWRNTGAEESFKMCERKTGIITGIYVRIDDRFFTFDDSILMPHAECCDRVRASKAFTGPDEGKARALSSSDRDDR